MSQTAVSTIGFFDLLGMREYARNEPERFRKAVVSFKECVERGASQLGKHDTVYLFADCAYFETNSVDRAVKFITYVRSLLLQGGFYMKGAIGAGTLEAVDAGPRPGAKKSKSTQPVNQHQIVRGHTFKGQVVEVYALQDSLKGIGIRVHPSLAARLERRRVCIESCHLTDSSARSAECFSDLRFGASDLDREILRYVMTDFFISSTRSRNFGRSYITLLITWIRSFDFRAGSPREIDPLAEDTIRFLIDPAFEKNVQRLPGAELMYFALLDKLYKEFGNIGDGPKAIHGVQEYMAKRRWLISRLETVPVCIFSRESRGWLLDYLSRSVKVLEPKRSTAAKDVAKGEPPPSQPSG